MRREREIEGIKKDVRKSKEERRLNKTNEVKYLEKIEPKEKENETDTKQKREKWEHRLPW